MAEVLLVILGAVVGAAGSIVGSIVVNRHEVRRRSRVRIYHELLPPLIDRARRSQLIVMEDIEPLRREALLAGRQDNRLAWAILHATGAQQAAAAFGAPDKDEATEKAREEWREASLALDDALSALDDHVLRKLRRRGRYLPD